MPDIAPFNINDSFVKWQQPIKERYEYITPWADSVEACLIKYEDLSGNNGEECFAAAINKILDYLSLTDKRFAKVLTNNLIDKNSQTFHSGKSGGWKDEFTKKNTEEFIAAGGEELVKQFNYKPSANYFNEIY
ncbi:MAG TPA: hypothetical protein DEG69_20720 [Flavobacteriaceae bacterium]|nr:hypothetical protein [Flavobacteriaceae bacterium]